MKQEELLLPYRFIQKNYRFLIIVLGLLIPNK